MLSYRPGPIFIYLRPFNSERFMGTALWPWWLTLTCNFRLSHPSSEPVDYWLVGSHRVPHLRDPMFHRPDP